MQSVGMETGCYKRCIELIDDFGRRKAWTLEPAKRGMAFQDPRKHWPPMKRLARYGSIWTNMARGSYPLPPDARDAVTTALRAHLERALPEDLSEEERGRARATAEQWIAALLDACVEAKAKRKQNLQKSCNMCVGSFDMPKHAELPARAWNLLDQQSDWRRRRCLTTWAGFVEKTSTMGRMPKEDQGQWGRRMTSMKGIGTITHELFPEAAALLATLVPPSPLRDALAKLLETIVDRSAEAKARKRAAAERFASRLSTWSRPAPLPADWSGGGWVFA